MDTPKAVVEDLVKQTENLVAGLRAMPVNSRFSASALEAVYGMAYALLQQGRHEQARAYFAFLLLNAPADSRFHAGLAITCQLAGEHAQALHFFSLASYLQPDRPHYVVRMAECFLHLGMIGAARELLKLTVSYCEEGQRDEAIRQRAQAMLDILANERAAA